MAHRSFTPVTFSREEVHEIQGLVGKGMLSRCPHCGGTLEVHNPLAGGGAQGIVWHVRCENCSRVAFLTDLPESLRPKPSN